MIPPRCASSARTHPATRHAHCNREKHRLHPPGETPPLQTPPRANPGAQCTDPNSNGNTRLASPYASANKILARRGLAGTSGPPPARNHSRPPPKNRPHPRTSLFQPERDRLLQILQRLLHRLALSGGARLRVERHQPATGLPRINDCGQRFHGFKPNRRRTVARPHATAKTQREGCGTSAGSPPRSQGRPSSRAA
jgi:hypothetical protein